MAGWPRRFARFPKTCEPLTHSCVLVLSATSSVRCSVQIVAAPSVTATSKTTAPLSCEHAAVMLPGLDQEAVEPEQVVLERQHLEIAEACVRRVLPQRRGA